MRCRRGLTILENLVASHLLKLCHFVEDAEGHRVELRFLRDTDGREVDFLVLRDRRPLLAVEAKAGERGVAPAVRCFRERTAIPTWYQVHRHTRDLVVDGVRILPLLALCREVGIPWLRQRLRCIPRSPADGPVRSGRRCRRSRREWHDPRSAVASPAPHAAPSFSSQRRTFRSEIPTPEPSSSSARSRASWRAASVTRSSERQKRCA